MVAVSYCLVVCCGVCLTYCLAVVGCWSPGVVAKLDFRAVDFSWISGGLLGGGFLVDFWWIVGWWISGGFLVDFWVVDFSLCFWEVVDF